MPRTPVGPSLAAAHGFAPTRSATIFPRTGEFRIMNRSIGWLVAAWGLCATVAPAQDIMVPAQPVAYEAYSYYDYAGAQPSQSDQPAVADKNVQAPVQAPAAEEAAPNQSCGCCGLFGHAGRLGPLC